MTRNSVLILYGLLMLVTQGFAQQVFRASYLEQAGGAYYDPKITLGDSLLSGVVIDTYSNGKPKVWKEIHNGLANGLWQEWYENGQLRFSAYWKDGYGHGSWRYYHSNGQLRQDEYYERDQPVGIHTAYFNNGQVRERGAYEKGKKQGPWEMCRSIQRIDHQKNPERSVRTIRGYVLRTKNAG